MRWPLAEVTFTSGFWYTAANAGVGTVGILGKSDCRVKFVTDRPLADPDAAARKLLELANAVEPVRDGRIYVEQINGPFFVSAQGHACGIQGRP